MWLRLDGPGMTDDVIKQVEAAEPGAPRILPGECSTWLNPDSGARMLHVQFGEYRSPDRSQGVWYRAPNGELIDVFSPVMPHFRPDRTFREGDDDETMRENGLRWREVDQYIEVALGLKDGKFEG